LEGKWGLRQDEIESTGANESTDREVENVTVTETVTETETETVILTVILSLTLTLILRYKEAAVKSLEASLGARILSPTLTLTLILTLTPEASVEGRKKAVEDYILKLNLEEGHASFSTSINAILKHSQDSLEIDLKHFGLDKEQPVAIKIEQEISTVVSHARTQYAKKAEGLLLSTLPTRIQHVKDYVAKLDVKGVPAEEFRTAIER